MPGSQEHVGSGTPMGATLVDGGATFRAWAPRAAEVFVLTRAEDLQAAADPQSGFAPRADDALTALGDGTWAGFVAGVADGSPYRFWVAGRGSAGPKRDPYARELGNEPKFPDCDCLVRAGDGYPWHDQEWRTPDFSDLVIYQLHIGMFWAVDEHGNDARAHRYGGFLDLIDRIDYLRELGVNAVQPLPVQEFPTGFSLGYNGTDYFSPEAQYQVESDAEIAPHLERANALLAAHGKPPLTIADIRSGPNQLKLFIDLCHLNGMAVIFDVVYNHAGGGFDDQSLFFFDRMPTGDNADSLYFTRDGWAGGLVFDYANPGVRQFIINNALFLLGEYHGDGLRYDEVSVMDSHGGWRFCQDLTSTVRFAEPRALQIAEYWNDWRWLAVLPPPDGMGFDAALADGLRGAVRTAVEQASAGAGATVDVEAVGRALYPPFRFPDAWRAVQHVENHDIVRAGRERRIAALADPSDARSWYARSRSRVATGLVLTAPGIPMLFMGQELLEEKQWDDNRDIAAQTLVDWAELATGGPMRDHLAFTRDLVALRRRLPALRGERVDAFHARNDTRVLAFHRWMDALGDDVVVVCTLAEQTWYGYELGFPLPGRWREVFNSDWYDGMPNPRVAGNGGGIDASGPPRDGLPCSAAIVVPANALLVFTRE